MSEGGREGGSGLHHGHGDEGGAHADEGSAEEHHHLPPASRAYSEHDGSDDTGGNEAHPPRVLALVLGEDPPVRLHKGAAVEQVRLDPPVEPARQH